MKDFGKIICTLFALLALATLFGIGLGSLTSSFAITIFMAALLPAGLAYFLVQSLSTSAVSAISGICAYLATYAVIANMANPILAFFAGALAAVATFCLVFYLGIRLMAKKGTNIWS